LNDRDSSYSVIHELSEQMIDLGNDYQVRPIGIKPIPLTEEWLLKFGFEKNENSIYFLQMSSNHYLYFNLDTNKGGLATEDTDDSYEVIITDKLNEIHQLQNLYFALTGEELELKD
jgi:hypothetical protein